MKKLLISTALCALLLAGCDSASPPPTNGYGTQSVGVSDNAPAGPGATTPPLGSSAGQAEARAPIADRSHIVVEISEKLFIAQTNDIYYNPEEYLGKTVKLEGIFSAYTSPETGAVYYSVLRYGPGCCGNDGYAGFEVLWDGDYPNNDDWVEAAGVLEEYVENGFAYLRLSLTSLTVLPTRGAEFVSQ
jgi:uncharacterized protein YcfL